MDLVLREMPHKVTREVEVIWYHIYLLEFYSCMESNCQYSEMLVFKKLVEAEIKLNFFIRLRSFTHSPSELKT